MPRTENKLTPKVIGDMLYHESGGIAVGSPEWYTWLEQEENKVFYVELQAGTFTARREPRRSGGLHKYYWYAYRQKGHKLCKAYLGTPRQLTLTRLVNAAQQITEKFEALS